MRILITGGSGLVGSAFKRIKTNYELILVDRTRVDLLDSNQFFRLLYYQNPEAVIHLAAKVGGVKTNTDQVSDFYYQNIQINCNVLNMCNLYSELHPPGIVKVVSLLSTCVYPDSVNYPLTENQIHNGPPHQSNFGYAYAKRMLDVHSRAMRQQHGRNYVCAIPNNIYGPNDNFDLENGHVIPALIRKIHEAKLTGKPPVFWGDGSALREFTYSKDIAESLMFVLENYNEEQPINIGKTSEEISIKDLVNLISELIGYEGEILWDAKMPSGQLKKPSSNKRFLELGWDDRDYTSLQVGLSETINWYLENYPNVRGVKI